MQIYFHSRLWSYLPRVPILMEDTVYIYIYTCIYVYIHVYTVCIYIYIYMYIQPQIRKSWDSMENANKKKSSDF